MIKTRKLKVWVARGEDGIYDPGNLLPLAVYSSFENAKLDGWETSEITEASISYKYDEEPKYFKRRIKK